MNRAGTVLKRFILPFILLISAIVWYAVFYFEARQNLLVSFFDIGQGDAIFIESPNGNQILVDGGPADKILARLGRTLPFWDRSIDLLILTHTHADHLDGLLEVLKRYRVGAILESGASYSLPEYEEWHRLLKEKNVPIVTARRGQKIMFSQNGELDILSPFENFAGMSLKNPHDANIVSRLSYGENSFLLTGDAEKTLEYRMLLAGSRTIKSDVLKVGHHGSKTSSSEGFLEAVSPKIAVIQVGRKNRYGHPTQEVLDRLSAAGAEILRNDLAGDIIIESDGVKYGLLK